MTNNELLDAIGPAGSEWAQDAKAPRRHRHLPLVIAAAAAVFVLFCGFTFGPQIVAMLGGGSVSIYSEENFTSVQMENDSADVPPAEVRDGRIFFTLAEPALDITDQCSETEYYTWETTDSDGVRHVLIVGGTPETMGWAEFLFVPNDNCLIITQANFAEETEPQWYTNARQVFCP